MTVPVTPAAIAQLRARSVNAITRAIAQDGIVLTHEQADDLGEEVLDWMRDRLGLDRETTERGVEYRPR